MPSNDNGGPDQAFTPQHRRLLALVALAVPLPIGIVATIVSYLMRRLRHPDSHSHTECGEFEGKPATVALLREGKTALFGPGATLSDIRHEGDQLLGFRVRLGVG